MKCGEYKVHMTKLYQSQTYAGLLMGTYTFEMNEKKVKDQGQRFTAELVDSFHSDQGLRVELLFDPTTKLLKNYDNAKRFVDQQCWLPSVVSVACLEGPTPRKSPAMIYGMAYVYWYQKDFGDPCEEFLAALENFDWDTHAIGVDP